MYRSTQAIIQKFAGPNIVAEVHVNAHIFKPIGICVMTTSKLEIIFEAKTIKINQHVIINYKTQISEVSFGKTTHITAD